MIVDDMEDSFDDGT
jgi:hypothetical protein